MIDDHLSLQPVHEQDFDAMADLRIAAMRDSLQRLGRFDPQRARDRLRAGFVPAFMHHIVWDGLQRIGFITLRPEAADPADQAAPALRLDHLYLSPAHQGRGIGAWVLHWAMAQAYTQQCLLKLTALQRSDANRFYQRHGFVLEAQDELDVHYRWVPPAGPWAPPPAAGAAPGTPRP